MGSTAWWATVAAALPVAIVAAVVLDVCKAVGDRQYKRLPFRVLKVASRVLPAEIRKSEYEQNWLPELHHILTDSPGGELRRYGRGTMFAASLLVGARVVVREAGALGPWQRFCVQVPSRSARVFAIVCLVASPTMFVSIGLAFVSLPFDSHPVSLRICAVAFEIAVGSFMAITVAGFCFVAICQQLGLLGNAALGEQKRADTAER